MCTFLMFWMLACQDGGECPDGYGLTKDNVCMPLAEDSGRSSHDPGLAMGEECGRTADCADDLICMSEGESKAAECSLAWGDDCGDLFGVKRCLPAQAGAACNADEECVDGLVCLTGSGSKLCGMLAGYCHMSRPVGSPCCPDGGSDPFGNVLTTVCDPGLVCSEDLVCVPA